MPTSASALRVDGLCVAYGAVVAVSNVTLSVAAGDLVALLGSNGAGKTTLLRTISGLLQPRAGQIHLGDRRLDGMPARRVARTGLTHVPEGRMVVAPLTVEENLLVAAKASRRRRGGEIGEGLDEVYELFPRLRDRRGQTSGLLSGGEQQMLAIGRGIMARPSVLLIDEPSMGLAPIVIDEIYQLLEHRRGTLLNTAVLLAEQSAAFALAVAGRAYVLARGAVTWEGPADRLDEDTMLSAYLGVAQPVDAAASTRGDGGDDGG